MEDAVDIKDDVAGFRVFTVYDGHAGDEAVTVVKKILPGILKTHLEEEDDVEKAICLAFRKIDEELTQTLLAAADTPPKVKISSGTVACMALIKGKDLWVCNLGDCRAVLCTGGTKVHAVSKDHAPEKNAAEAERLRTLGVQVNGGYVEDHVAVSRALGNIHYESGKKVEGVISEPDVFKIAVDEEVDFLILASDGIWDPLKDQFAVTLSRMPEKLYEPLSSQKMLRKPSSKMRPRSAQLTMLPPLLWSSSFQSPCRSALRGHVRFSQAWTSLRCRSEMDIQLDAPDIDSEEDFEASSLRRIR